MGTLAEGIKEIFATAKTSGSNVMLCGNDGTPDGHIDMANLASVLGVGINTSETDFNNLVNPGVYNIGNCSSMANHPTGSNDTCILLVYKSSGGLIQLLCGLYNNQLFKRTKYNNKYNNWREWESVSADIPSFYKNYNDLSSLASALGVQIESFTSNSHYGYTFPTADGFAIKLAINARNFVLFCLGDSGKLYYKYIWQGSDNMDWQLINVVQK